MQYLDLGGNKEFKQYYFQSTLLIMLFIFHIYWWILICRMLVKLFRDSGKVSDDVRSDSEGEDWRCASRLWIALLLPKLQPWFHSRKSILIYNHEMTCPSSKLSCVYAPAAYCCWICRQQGNTMDDSTLGSSLTPQGHEIILGFGELNGGKLGFAVYRESR